MSVKVAKVQFNGGELSPWLEGRFDLEKYDKTAKLCRNFIPMAEGCLKRRGGTLFMVKTPDSNGVLFKINVYPIDAKIIINGNECEYLYVEEGETVSYEVYAEGYTSCMGTKIVNEDTVLDVILLSNAEMCKLTINANPEDAVIKIDGLERKNAEFLKNSKVSYIVYAKGYKLKKGEVVLTSDIILDVVLDKEEGEQVNYDDWGDVIDLVACSVVGDISQQQKCFYIKFSNGYLPIIFDANEIAPKSDFVDDSLFFYSLRDGYNAICKVDNDYVHTKIIKNNNAIRYNDLDGNLVLGIDGLIMQSCGWPIDERNMYASIYEKYDGVVSNNIIKIYYDGNLVWELKGRNNG